MTHVSGWIAAGVKVAFGYDCVMDPCYGECCDYKLKVAHVACMWRG